MSDLLAATGWIGEHPVTGADVAHLLLYPATDTDPDSPAKIAAIAALVGAMDAYQQGQPPALSDVEIDLSGTLLVGGEVAPLPVLTGQWRAAARGVDRTTGPILFAELAPEHSPAPIPQPQRPAERRIRTPAPPQAGRTTKEAPVRDLRRTRTSNERRLTPTTKERS